MAGDWIPITTDLATRREVLLISEATGLSRYEVVGRLVDFWGWASHETTDGQLCHVSVATLCATLSLPEAFFRALIDAEWLEEAPDGLVVSNWERWLSNGAKARLGSALRQKLYRKKQGKSVTTSVVTKALPKKSTEEKSTEEKKKAPCSPPAGDGAPAIYSDEFEGFWTAVPPRKRGAKQAALRAYRIAVKLLKGREADPHAFLQERATAYYASPLGQTQYCNGAAPFLNQGHYDDDPQSWERKDARTISAGPGQRHPEAGRSEPGRF